jgi:hypothetical protein
MNSKKNEKKNCSLSISAVFESGDIYIFLFFSFLFFICAFILAGGSFFISYAARPDKNQAPYRPPDFLEGISSTGEVLAAIKKEFALNPGLIDLQLKSRLDQLLNFPQYLGYTSAGLKFSSSSNEIAFDSLSIRLNNALFDSLNVETASIDINKISFDAAALFLNGRLRVKTQEEISAEIKMAEKDLNEYLKFKAEKIKVRRPYVKFDNEKLLLGGNVKYGVFIIKFDAAGVFKIVDGTKIHFDIKKLEVNKMRMPGNFVRKIISQINPIMDLDKFPFKLEMKSINVSDKYLIFSSK